MDAEETDGAVERRQENEDVVVLPGKAEDKSEVEYGRRFERQDGSNLRERKPQKGTENVETLGATPDLSSKITSQVHVNPNDDSKFQHQSFSLPSFSRDDSFADKSRQQNDLSTDESKSEADTSKMQDQSETLPSLKSK